MRKSREKKNSHINDHHHNNGGAGDDDGDGHHCLASLFATIPTCKAFCLLASLVFSLPRKVTLWLNHDYQQYKEGGNLLQAIWLGKTNFQRTKYIAELVQNSWYFFVHQHWINLENLFNALFLTVWNNLKDLLSQNQIYRQEELDHWKKSSYVGNILTSQQYLLLEFDLIWAPRIIADL